MKICFRCKKKIEEKDNYYIFTEFNKKKEIGKEYTHKKCYHDFLSQKKNIEESMGMMRDMKEKLVEFGLLPKKKFIIE